MKLITIMIISALMSASAASACTITVLQKSDRSRGAGYVNGVYFGSKQINALRPICTVSLKIMSTDQRVKLIQDEAAAKVRRIKGGN